MLKKILFITGGIILLLLVSTWVYLLLFGTPISQSGLFANFNETPATEREVIENTETQTQLADSTQLQQLTTRPVAGYIFLKTESATTTDGLSIQGGEYLRYLERGTGHIYEIDLDNGIEEKISATTIKQATEAYFNPSGLKVIIVSDSETQRKSQLLSLTDDRSVNLGTSHRNFQWLDDNTYRHTETNTDNTTSYYENTDGTDSLLWTTPLSSVDVRLFGDESVVINKMAPNLQGGVFFVLPGQLDILVKPEYSLTALPDRSGTQIAYSYYDTQEKNIQSRLLDIETEQDFALSLLVAPEKCDFSDTSNTAIYCAVSDHFVEAERDTLNQWYKGEISVADNLWVMETTQGSAKYFAPVSDQTGYNVDITDLQVAGQYIFFRNKINDTLWKYQLED